MPATQVRFASVPRDYSRLSNISQPNRANDAEFMPWTFFDTQGSGTTILAGYTFFASVQTDQTLGNLPQANTLADGQFFSLEFIGFEVLQPVTAASEVNCNNLITLYYVSRPYLEIGYANKQYGQYPLSHIARPGGFSVSSAIVTHSEATFNSDAVGVWINGALMFQPRQTFTMNLRCVAGGSITTASLNMRLSIIGTFYRRVL